MAAVYLAAAAHSYLIHGEKEKAYILHDSLLEGAR